MYHSSFLSAITIILPSAEPFSSNTLATSSMPSRADFTRGSTKSTSAASAKPFFTSGSIARILSWGVAEVVAVMVTPYSFCPCAPYTPSSVSRLASGTEVYLNSCARCG